MRDAYVACLISAQAKPALSRSVGRCLEPAQPYMGSRVRGGSGGQLPQELLRADALLPGTEVGRLGDRRRRGRISHSPAAGDRRGRSWLCRRRRLLGAGDCSSEGHEQGEGDRLHGSLLVHGESAGNHVPFLQSTDELRRFARLIVAGFEPPGTAPRVDRIRKARYFSGRYRLGDSRPNRRDR